MWQSKTGHNIIRCSKMRSERRVIKTKTQVIVFRCLYIGICNLVHTKMMNMPINYVNNTLSKSEITKYFDRLKL